MVLADRFVCGFSARKNRTQENEAYRSAEGPIRQLGKA
jgi:hypothetical protein